MLAEFDRHTKPAPEHPGELPDVDTVGLAAVVFAGLVVVALTLAAVWP